MTDKLVIEKLNAVYAKVLSDEAIARELNAAFSFEVPGAKFQKRHRGNWDGRIKLFNLRTRQIYAGLWPQIADFARKRGYEVEYKHEDFVHQQFDPKLIEWWATPRNLDLPSHITPYDYQIEALCQSAQKRALFLSPTGSGKSLIIYLIFRWWKLKTLIIVPNSGLLLQMQTDFQSYGYQEPIGQWGDSVKDDNADVVVATWQSAVKENIEWLSQFDMVIVDEAHLATSASIRAIMEKLNVCELRFGFTGTLNGTKCHQMVLEGLFGPVVQVEKTANLIERGILAPFEVKVIKLNHPAWARKHVKNQCPDYQDEIKFLINNEKRNKFIRNLALSLKGNTLLMINEIEEHGHVLLNMIKEKAPDRKVLYIHGGVDPEVRNKIRAYMEKHDDIILIGSSGTMQIGSNIKNLHNLIMGRPWKSTINNLQSIGRILRSLPGKKATLYDIGDDLSWKKHQNHTLRHLAIRLETYHAEEFDPQIHNVEIKYEENVNVGGLPL